MPALKKYGEGRIINVASEAHKSTIAFPLEEYHTPFIDTAEDRFRAYGYSKFCLILFSQFFQSILKATSKVTIHCVDPGNTETNIYRNFPQLSNPFYYYLQKPIRLFVIKTPNEGAQSVIHALCSENPPFYIKNLKEYQEYSYRIENIHLQQQLWMISKKMCQPYSTKAVMKLA